MQRGKLNWRACESQEHDDALRKHLRILFRFVHLIFQCHTRVTTKMSSLRRRIFGVGDTPDSTPSISREASPAPPREGVHDAGEYRLVPREGMEKLKKEIKSARRSGKKRRNAWMFALGGLFGVILAGFFASSNGSLDGLVEMAGMQDMNLDSLLDVLPAGLIRDVQDLQVRLQTQLLLNPQADVDQRCLGL